MGVNSTANRSTFVTVVAWIFIAFSGFGTLISILQNIMIHTMFNSAEIEHALQAPPPPGMPPFPMFLANNFTLFLAAVLVVSAITLASSIGLLLRKNWARLIFVGLMVFGIVWNLAGLVLQFEMFSSMQESIARPPGAPDMKLYFAAIAVVSVVFALAFSVLFGWIAKRLLSPGVAVEFKRSA
jgi:hypothetical protein